MKAIWFDGCDGSGKTTFINKLSKVMSARGIKVRVDSAENYRRCAKDSPHYLNMLDSAMNMYRDIGIDVVLFDRSPISDFIYAPLLVHAPIVSYTDTIEVMQDFCDLFVVCNTPYPVIGEDELPIIRTNSHFIREQFVAEAKKLNQYEICDIMLIDPFTQDAAVILDLIEKEIELCQKKPNS